MFEEAQLLLRQSLWGRLPLRRRLPQRLDATPGEHFYYRLLLEAGHHVEDRRAVGQVIDVGCRNWSYVAALAESFPQAQLIGIEVDGDRRYWNLHRRIDYARAHAAALPPDRADVRAGDFCDQRFAPPRRGARLFCFLFPFVSPHPCRRWGLPQRFAHYERLVRHALATSATTPTRWLAVHQGHWEADVAAAIYQRLGLPMRRCRLAPERWRGRWPSPHPSYVFSG